MHDKDTIEEVDFAAGCLTARRGGRFLLATPVPDFVSGWKPGDQIWVSEVGRSFELQTIDRMDEIASAVRVRSKSDS
jgi:hypothetical protein